MFTARGWHLVIGCTLPLMGSGWNMRLLTVPPGGGMIVDVQNHCLNAGVMSRNTFELFYLRYIHGSAYNSSLMGFQPGSTRRRWRPKFLEASSIVVTKLAAWVGALYPSILLLFGVELPSLELCHCWNIGQGQHAHMTIISARLISSFMVCTRRSS